MPLRLEIISYQRARLGERRVKEFGAKGGTIGRSLESDWSLEDGNRYLSSRHAAIDFRSGSYYIVDTSTNGVFVNDGDTPIGRAKPQRLFHDDRLRLGDYVMRVHLEESDPDEDLDEDSHVDPVEKARQIETPTPAGYTLLSEDELGALAVEEILADDTTDDALKAAAEQAASSLQLVDDDTKPPRPEQPAPKPKQKASKEPSKQRRVAKPTKTEDSKATATSAEAPTDQSAVYALLRGAGLPPRELEPEDAAMLLHRAGQLVRELAIGLRRSIEMRVEQKNTLRLATTTIQPQNNNLLKFSPNVDEALENLFFMQKPEYMPAVDAVREGFDDVTAHEQALLNAAHAALLDYLERLDPEEIEQKCGDGKRGLLGAKAEAKYWERYAELYMTLAEHAPGQFPQIFAEVFTGAYEREIAKQSSATRKSRARGKTA